MLSKKNQTPIVDFLLENRDKLQANFHALPMAGMSPGKIGYDKYKKLFGSKYFTVETTISGKLFDSFYYPVRCIKTSQNNAAELFGAKDSLFVTGGTSLSNQIVVDALLTDKSHVLLDRECHQSMHFSVREKTCHFDYFYSDIYCEATERKCIKINELLKKIRQSIKEKSPYDVVILGASSYDGVIYSVYQIIKKITALSPTTQFIVDEAWSSAFYCHPDLYEFTAAYAAKKLKHAVNIVSTQSAHKSLMTMRQASFIHSFASDEITERLYKSRFKLHSTSPNYAILASMDLAVAQMNSNGKAIVSNALHCASYFREQLASHPTLSEVLHVNSKDKLGHCCDEIMLADPLKIHINLKPLGLSGQDLQEYLYQHFGVYCNRYTRQTILVNVHIGIEKQQINLLIDALLAIKKMNETKKIALINSNDFIISYPPGIPMHTPGEVMNHKQINAAVEDKLQTGINVFQVI
jgi:arginine/lysine/ornithine decarboxylase